MGLSSLVNLFNRVPGFNRLRSPLIAMGQSVLLTSFTVTGLVVGLWTLGIFERPGLALYDQFVRLQPDRPPDERLLVVGINEADLQGLTEWPLSDATLAQALELLQVHQPRVIGVDVLRDIPIGGGRDRLLTQVQATNVVIVCKVSSASDPGVAPPAGLPPEAAVFADLVVDPGGTLRRSLLYLNPPPPPSPATPSHVCNMPETVVSLSFGMALNYLAGEGITASFTDDDELLIGSTLLPALTSNFGSYQRADVAGYQLMLRYRAEESSVPMVSLTDVLNGQVADELIRDRIVLIGYTTPLAKDDFYTPYSISRDDQQKMPGVIVHAQSTSQILSVVLDGRSLIADWPLLAVILWIGGWSLATGVFAWYVKHPARFIPGLLVLSGTAYGAALLLFWQGTWVPIVPVLVTVVTTSSSVVLVERFNRGDYGKRFVDQVKTLLHIDVDIDEAKRHQQVAEITETEYFQNLKRTAKALRSRSKKNSPTSNAEATNPDAESATTQDYLADLKAKARQLKHKPDSSHDK
ncbi:MAG: CHASE2 domain-containing protein [Cyanobacteria bacterium J06639_14]